MKLDKIVAAIVWVHGGLFGCALALAVQQTFTVGFGSVTPPIKRVTQAEVDSGFIQAEVPPMDIELRFVKPGEIPDPYYAYSHPHMKPCRVVMPAGAVIYASPSLAWPRAKWVSADTAAVLAHEILHCTKGSWHQEGASGALKAGKP